MSKELDRWNKIAGLPKKDNTKSKTKQQLDENVVGVGAINPIFAKREPKDYELAFEHYLGEMYDSKKENVDEDLDDLPDTGSNVRDRTGVRLDNDVDPSMSPDDIIEGIKTIERLQDAFPHNAEFNNHLELAKVYLLDQIQ